VTTIVTSTLHDRKVLLTPKPCFLEIISDYSNILSMCPLLVLAPWKVVSDYICPTVNVTTATASNNNYLPIYLLVVLGMLL
jgi:hypothetical protein